MAENILVVMNKEDLQPLANDIKTLNGLSQSKLITLDGMEKAIEDANDAIASQENLIAQISAALEGKAAGGGAPADPVLQEKTVSPSTSQQSVTPDSGYDGLSKVTVNAMPAGSVANPSITVNSSGLVTATAAVNAGYVDGTDKTGTKQLTVQAAQTITPGTSNKTIASGRYLTGTQTIKGDANLKAANIAKGVSIFNVTGTHEGGEDISSETAEYTTLLNNLETAIDALPEAGSGGGSVETCNLILRVSLFNHEASFSVFKNGVITSGVNWEFGVYDLSEVTIPDVVCNSLVAISGYYDEGFGVNWETSSANFISYFGDYGAGTGVFKITAQAGETATIEVFAE